MLISLFAGGAVLEIITIVSGNPDAAKKLNLEGYPFLALVVIFYVVLTLIVRWRSRGYW